MATEDTDHAERTEHADHTEYFELVCDDLAYDVVITDPGARVLEVAQAVRELTGLSLWRGKVLATEVPAVILGGVPEADAEAAVAALRAVGAGAEMREWLPPDSPMP
ncbi:ribosomal protein L7/L12 [Streptomyces sp. NBC_01478]|uniref:ribosomal protein L7/L12 n=1 Tax=Streptomyces sp. NBC_01478 TaxID=2903882 RepID=UPI002E35F7AF|nr:ribosomal protein L7/L12 [Streptomyces sp. NBC_01478]